MASIDLPPLDGIPMPSSERSLIPRKRRPVLRRARTATAALSGLSLLGGGAVMATLADTGTRHAAAATTPSGSTATTSTSTSSTTTVTSHSSAGSSARTTRSAGTRSSSSTSSSTSSTSTTTTPKSSSGSAKVTSGATS